MRHLELCIDANDPGRLRPFWALALGYREQPQPDGSVDLVDPDGRGPLIWFQPVPEVKSVKNRLHLDVFVDLGQRTRLVEALVGLGGSVLRDLPDYTVLADPEGNELCISDQDGSELGISSQDGSELGTSGQDGSELGISGQRAE